MNIFKIVVALRAAGLFFSEIGELLRRLGEIRGSSNLEDSRTPEPDHEPMSQDSLNPCNGVKDEEPEGYPGWDETFQDDLFETLGKERSPPDT